MKSFYKSHIISLFFFTVSRSIATPPPIFQNSIPNIVLKSPPNNFRAAYLPHLPPPTPSCIYIFQPSSTQPFSFHYLYRIHVSIFPKYRHMYSYMYFFKIHIPLLFLIDIRTPPPPPFIPYTPSSIFGLDYK